MRSRTGWKRGPVGVARDELIRAADRTGLLRVCSAQLAERAGVSQSAAHRWLNGVGTSPALQRRLIAALGLGEPQR